MGVQKVPEKTVEAISVECNHENPVSGNQHTL